jgi:type VI secretion system secreted protein VgrG
MSPTQASRNVEINTSLGKDKILIQNAAISESLGCLFNVDAELTSTDANISFDRIVGTNATIRLELNKESTRYFNGFVSRFVLTQVDKGYAHYRMTLVPWLWFLTRTSDCRIFQKKKVPDIIKEVFNALGFHDFREALTGNYDPWEYCVQYRETDFNFVSRLMEHEGIYYFFEHENGKHTLVLADSHTAHKPKAGVEKVVFRPNPDGAKDKDYIHSFVVEQEVQPGTYVLNDFNFEKPKTSLKGQTDQSKNHAQAKFEIYDYPGEYEEPQHSKDMSQIRIQELHAQHEVARGQSNDRAMDVGATFTLAEYPRQDWNKKYLITSTSLHITSDEFESGGQSGGDFYSCSFTAIPATVQYRAPRLTPKPLIQGPQTAFVTGPKGEEIHTDKYGRIKVQFHWDRYGKADENSSCWVRVSQAAWAGKKWGAMYIPRIGQEVIVEFLEGDPDLPIVTGRVYNADTMPPYDLPAEKTKTTLKSQSSKGGGGFNEIRFEDKKGSEQVFIHAERNQDVRVKKDSFETIGENRHLVVKKDQFEKITGDKHLTIGGEQNEKIGESLSVKTGLNITLQAGATITLKAGGNFITVGPDGISISGTMIRINSGGSPGSATAPQPAREADNGQGGQIAQTSKSTERKKPTSYSPQAATLKQAAKSGTPFCAKCAAATPAKSAAPIPPPGKPSGDLAKSAYKMIGTSTANIPGTDGGNLGCAAAVSKIFKDATGENILPGRPVVLGTGDLASGLAKDPRFQAVPIDKAKPGDIIVTPRGTRAGHTGVVGKDGHIISNSSSGYHGSKPGTIQDNYTVDKWQSSVSPRNPGKTVVYRYVGPKK